MPQVQSTFVMRNPPYGAELSGAVRGTKPAVAPLEFKLQLAPGEGGVAGVVLLSVEAAAGSPTAMLLAETLELAAASLRRGAPRVELDLARPVGAQDGAHG